MTPFQDYVALGAACISAALLFASTPAQSTKSDTHFHQATAGTMLARGTTEPRIRCLSAYRPLFVPEFPRLAACMPATE